jgi:hypothetical protein
MAVDEWLPAVTEAIRKKDGWALHSYGDVEGQAPDRVWATVEDLPRYTHNYWGMRNRFGILSETYSYLTFQERIATVSRFLEEILAFSHANAGRLRKITEEADARSIIGHRLALRSRVKRSDTKAEILMGETTDEINPYSGERMLRRLDVRKPEQMWLETSFELAESERVPSSYYVPATLTSAIERLQAHGIRLERLEQTSTLSLEEFRIATSQVTSQLVERHQERTVTGQYETVERTLPAGMYYRIPLNQPLARLAFYLLEPRSNDGLVTWNFLDDAMKSSNVYPIMRTRD